MNLILLLLALNALPVSSLGKQPRVGEITMNKPWCDCANTFARVVEEDVKWKEPEILKGNTVEDRLRHDPE